MKKKSILIVFFAVTIIAIVLVFKYLYSEEYNIEYSNSSMEKFLTKNIERKSIEYIQLKELKKTNTVLFQFKYTDGHLGYAHFEKGINKKVKFISSNSVPEITYQEFETNNGLYGVILGKNDNLKISRIEAELSSENMYSFTVDVSGSDYFIEYNKLPEGISNTYLGQLILFDSNKNIIDD
ncbi:hypothetical protein [Lederbergia lenta]|uniref:Uncharacterized protein n=1 Tax=Lederbergia lenta TaxID=1467 RepID=A0A2X4WQZ1_LEDLE|nr:hypothetical protein [Lederbergia lenta]MCM3109836.1 hypothetical protein [Lederbergia lenta]MEC2324390.1 hypothetical protein [Lederbergia lenta]SQI60060.1 Uncharacterised protein [Lederbergia lenta]